MTNLYENLGISQKVYDFGENTLEKLKDRFSEVDKIAEYKNNAALQKYAEFIVGYK